MKISHRKITASSNKASVKIPAPFDKYYRIASDQDVIDYCGDSDLHPTPCEEAEGYDVKHISYVLPKPEYEDALADNAVDVVELITSGWQEEPQLAYTVGEEIYPVDMMDLQGIEDIDIESCDVTSAIDTGLEYWYLTKHGLGPGMMPQGVHLLDTVEDGWDTYILLDRMLTTEELNRYDIKEKTPPEELMACDDVTASIDDELDDIPSFDYSYNIVVPGIEKALGVDREIAHLIYTWYDLEDVWEDFDSLQDFLQFLQFDIRNMAEACDDEFEKNKVLKAIGASATCKKVSETDDEIRYIVSSDEEDEDEDDEQVIEGMSLVNYKNYQIIPDRHYFGWDIYDKETSQLVKDGFHSEEDAKSYIDINLSVDIYADEEIEDEEVEEEEEDFLAQPDQEFASAETAVNGKQGKLPAVFKKATIPTGALVLDYGGGTVESEAVAQDYLNQFDATEMLYDPFNQTEEHNRNVVSELRKNGGADVGICSNVLNVIKEEEVRLDLLNKIKKLLKPGAVAYISVYEGGGSGEGAATQSGKSYQNKRKLATYLDEVQSVFPNATRKGAVIIAPNTENANSSINGAIEIDNANIDLDALQEEIWEGVVEYMTGPKGGFEEPEVSDYAVAEVTRYDEGIKVEVRADISYDGMIELSYELDPIIANYNSDAYFDMEAPGIMTAYLPDTEEEFEDLYSSVDIEAGWKERYDDMLFNPPEPEDAPEEYEPTTIVAEVDFNFDVNNDGQYLEADEEEVIEGTDVDLEGEDLPDDALYQAAMDIVELVMGVEPGKYAIRGHATLNIDREYDYMSEDFNYYVDYKRSDYSQVEAIYQGPITSSTNIEAGMTNEEVKDAIEQGKPFDLDSFRNYWGGEDANAVRADQVQVGDIIDVEFDASEVDLGTKVKILSINDPGEDWIDYTFKCEVQEDWHGLHAGDIVTLHFDEDEQLGYVI